MFPIPNQEHIINGGAGAAYITTLDLNSGYWQIPLEEKSRQYTAFNDDYNQYEFVRMPFGLVNASATFSRMMNGIMAGLIGDEIYIYLNDIMIMSKDWSSHLIKLEKVFQRVQNANLTVKMSKCEFAKEATILGHKVNKKGVLPDPDKISAISKMREPANVKEVRAFLGMAGYHRKSIPEFASMSGPLVELTKKNNVFKWTNQHTRCFNAIKMKLSESKAIGFYIYGLPLMIKSDAPRTRIGAILLQLQDGEWRVVNTTSRRPSSAEKNYGITELEGAALIHVLTKFWPFIFDQDVVVLVDH